MLVPTASGVLNNRMPAFASDFDQAGMLAQAEELCPEGTFLNLLPVLQKHKEEPSTTARITTGQRLVLTMAMRNGRKAAG